MFGSKKLSAVIASVAVATLLLTGTFAWQQMITKTNEFIGTRDDVRLHDDFDPSTGAKDVYVENKSETPVFVRVKLNEAMDLTSSTWRPTTDSDWETHLLVNGPEDCTHENAAQAKFHENFTWIMGGSKYYLPATDASPVVQDTTVYSANDPGAKLTPDAAIIAIDEYLKLANGTQQAFIGWIYDTDGYAYWSQPLTKGEATGLLLHRAVVDPSLKGTEYYYAIDVLVEAVDLLDIPMWTQHAASVDKSGTTYPEATAEGKAVIGIITNITSITTP